MTRDTSRDTRRAAVIGVIAAALAVGFATPARADAPLSCTVLEIEASTTDAPSMDPTLKPLEKKLRKPPFSSWNTFKRLGVHATSLELMKESSVILAHGKAGLLLREVTKRGAKKPRVGLGIVLDDEDGKRVLDTKVQVDAGDYLVVGRSLKGGKGQLVALTCKL